MAKKSTLQRNRAPVRAKRGFAPIISMAEHLSRLPRRARIRLSFVLAITFTLCVAVLSFGWLFSVRGDAFRIGQVLTPEFVYTVTPLLMILSGLVAYWFGWRLLVGFDGETTMPQPIKAAARWVFFVIAFLAFTIVLSVGIVLYILYAPIL
jgi:cell division septal protein FtsQ